MKNYIFALAAGVVTCLFIYVLPYGRALDFIGLLLGVIAAIYIGFAISDGRKHVLLLECAVAAVFILLALLGMWGKPVWLVIGYFAHGAWDLIHHPGKLGTKVRKWYPPACVVYDWVVGLYLLYWLGWI
ncbi:MAG: hypothetical protein OEY52_06585 [Gammaproteobacteria bacterium]|nr:hypothetical protein [Gammaproteobacteria bacterium]